MGKTEFDVIVVGAGASGLMAALSAAAHGADVLLLEQKDKIGKKLLATGNGKCNFTNEDMDISHYYGDTELAATILGQFGKEETLRFFHELLIYPKKKNGYYYPNSEQAASVAAAFRQRLAQTDKICLRTSAEVWDIQREAGGFTVVTRKGARDRGKALVIACGLLASPKLGSDGSLFAVVKGLGHRFSPIVPALCGFYCKGADFKRLAGVRVSARVSILVDGTACASDTGELQLTDYGISGIPVFQVSRTASMALYEKKKVVAKLCFLPELSEEELAAELAFRRARMGADADIPTLLCGLLPEKLTLALAKGFVNGVSDLQRRIRCFPVTVERAREFAFAQVCAGGIRRGEIEKETLASALVPGLYFCGEILDVDGICGGYNLQWAWSSGYVAGKNAAGQAGNYD